MIYEMTIRKKDNTEIDLTQYLPNPIGESLRLDESLDILFTSLKNTPFNKPFEPFDTVWVKKTYGSSTYTTYWYVAEDNATAVIPTNTYNHDITLIEETKILERIICGTKTFTQPLSYVNYSKDSEQVVPIGYNYSSLFNMNAVNSAYTMPKQAGDTFTTKSLRELAKVSVISWYKAECKHTSSAGIQTTIYSYTGSGNIPTTTHTITAQSGTYTLYYALQQSAGGKIANFTYTMPCLQTIPTRPTDYTIWDVCTQIIETAETKRNSAQVGYYGLQLGTGAFIGLNDKYKYYMQAELQAIKSPEYSFSKQTLWEVFSIIGQKLHAIPKVINNRIYFQKINNNAYCGLDNTYNSAYLISDTQSWSNEQYCCNIESQVDNLIEVDDYNEGSVTEPFNSFYQTARAETGNVQITTEDTIIRTRYPIERLLKVEVGYLPNTEQVPVGDITKYVLERANYNMLSSYTTAYPCKAMSLYWDYGEKDIKGLTFKPEQAWANAFGLQLFNHYAIQNIICDKTGKTINELEALFTDGYDLKYLQYRVTYIPRISGRVSQVKPYLNDNTRHLTLNYNQTANLINNNSYGEGLKGVIARYGNAEREITLQIPYSDSVFIEGIAIGNYWGSNANPSNLVISQIDKQYYNDFARISLSLVPNFNRYSAYVGASNELRQYEVSERQAVEREAVLKNYFVISYDNDPTAFVVQSLSFAGANTVTSTAMTLLGNSFVNNNVGTPIDLAFTQGYDSNNIKTHSNYYNLPVIALATGNCMSFKFEYDDNYSAGNVVDPRISNNVSYLLQSYAPYSDFYGRIKSLEYQLGRAQAEPTYDFGEYYTIGNKLPVLSVNMQNQLFTGSNAGEAGDYRIALYKDSREKIKVNIEYHFITDDENIVIGSGIASTNALVSAQTNNYRVYILSYRLSQYDNLFDINEQGQIYDKDMNVYVDSVNTNGFGVNDITVSAQYKKCAITATYTANRFGSSWVIVDTNTKQLIMGRNMNISSGVTQITFPNIFPTTNNLKYKQ